MEHRQRVRHPVLGPDGEVLQGCRDPARCHPLRHYRLRDRSVDQPAHKRHPELFRRGAPVPGRRLVHFRYRLLRHTKKPRGDAVQGQILRPDHKEGLRRLQRAGSERSSGRFQMEGMGKSSGRFQIRFELQELRGRGSGDLQGLRRIRAVLPVGRRRCSEGHPGLRQRASADRGGNQCQLLPDADRAG